MTVSEGDLLRATLRYTYPAAGIALNIFEWTYGGIDREDVDFLADFGEWANDWSGRWNDLAAVDSELDAMDVVAIDNTGQVIRDLGTFLLNVSGTEIGTVSPAAVSGYLLANTAIPQVRGSKYVPAMAESAIDGGEFDAAAIVDLVLLLATYVTPFVLDGGGTVFPGVLSSKTAAFELFTGLGGVETLPAYQRRRKEGVGT